MLPVFQIRELGQDVQLDEKIQYDELIVDHPVATLGYVDDDDGEVITVGSSSELYDRIDELQSMRPIVFDLLTSLRSWPKASQTAEGLRVWIEFVNKNYKGKGKEQFSLPEPEVLVDVSDTPAAKDQDPEEEKPFHTAFEEELRKILDLGQHGTDVDIESAPAPSPPLSAFEPSASNPVYASITPADIISQAIQSIGWASQGILRLKQDLPQCAQPAVENLSNVVSNALGALSLQLSEVARDAADRAQRAANATRDVDTAEIAVVKEKIRHLAVGIGHVASQSAMGAQAVGRDVGRDFGEGFGVVANEARKAAQSARDEVVREVNKAREEIERNVQEAFGGVRGESSSTFNQNTENTEKEVVPEGERQHYQPTVEDEEDLYTHPPPHQASPKPEVEFVPASKYKSCADWLKDVKEMNARKQDGSRSPPCQEQNSAAFWEQMDRISRCTEQGGPSNSAPTPATGEQKVSAEKESEEQDGSGSSSSLSDGERGIRGDKRHHFGPRHRGRSSMGRPRDEPALDHRRRVHGGRRHHGPPHTPSSHRHFHSPRHHPRGPPPPPPHFQPPPGHPHSPHLPDHHQSPQHYSPGHHQSPPHHSPGRNFPPPPSPPHHIFGNGFAPPPPPPPPPPFPPHFASPDMTRHKYPPPPPPPAPPLHPHTSFRKFSSTFNHSEGNIDGNYGTHDDINVGQADHSQRGLRRARTIIGNSYGPPPAPFQGTVDLSRSISPASAMPPMPPIPSPRQPAIWRSSFSGVPMTNKRTFPVDYGMHVPFEYQPRHRMQEPEMEAGPSFNADPFATPPRAPSPHPDHESAPESFEDAQENHHEAAETVEPYLIETADEGRNAQPQMSEMPVMSTYPPFSGMFGGFGEYSGTQQPFSVVDTNPFTAAVRNQTEAKLPETFPSYEDTDHSVPLKSQEIIDLCVAQLVDMGYGVRGEDENDGDVVESLKVYAQMTEGNLEDAIEMIEEEKKVWEGH